MPAPAFIRTPFGGGTASGEALFAGSLAGLAGSDVSAGPGARPMKRTYHTTSAISSNDGQQQREQRAGEEVAMGTNGKSVSSSGRERRRGWAGERPAPAIDRSR